MIYAKTFGEAFDIRESMIFPDCFDIFNCWPGLCLPKKGTTVIELGLKIIAGLGEKCVLTDRYGYCVAHFIEVENKVVGDDYPLYIKLINRTNRDVMIPCGEILCQIMVLNIDMVGR
jgi:dUTPase